MDVGDGVGHSDERSTDEETNLGIGRYGKRTSGIQSLPRYTIPSLLQRRALH